MKSKHIILCSMITVLCLTACGSSSDSAPSSSGNWLSGETVSVQPQAINSKLAMSYDSAENSYDVYEEDTTPATMSSGSSEADIVKDTQMIIRDARIQAEVENLEEFDTYITDTISKYGGYFEYTDIENYTSEYDTTREADYKIRVPQTVLDDVISQVDAQGNITSKNVSSEDVSLQYVDNEAKIASLQSELQVLEELKLQATDVDDLITIQNEISNLQYQLDSANGQKRYLEGRVAYSTINLTAIEERLIDHPVRRAFQINLRDRLLDGMETTVEVFVTVIVAIPTILIITLFAIAFIWLVRKIWSKVFKKYRKNFKYMMVPVVLPDADTVQEAIKNTPTADKTESESKTEMPSIVIEQSNASDKISGAASYDASTATNNVNKQD